MERAETTKREMKNSQMYFLAMIVAFCTDKWLLGFTLVVIILYTLYKEVQNDKKQL